MTKLDWLLLIVFGLPVVTYVADYWRATFDEAAVIIRECVGWLRSRREG